LFFPDDRRFLNPPSMLEALKQQMQETEEEFDEDPISIAKMIFDSLAFRYASVLGSIESLTRRKLAHIQILGGGGRNRYINQITANASRQTVKAGLYEATVVGNVLVQAISAGRFESLTDARKHVTDNVAFLEFSPQISDVLADGAARYREIENRFLGSH
jgi:rhamnulokinase